MDPKYRAGIPEETYSRREYQIRKVSDWEEPAGRDLWEIEQTIDPVTNAVCTTGRQSTLHGMYLCNWHGSKTVENVTVHAFSYRVRGRSIFGSSPWT